jgi:hypothetical protein
MPNKKITIQERFKFTLNYIKNFMFIITPLTIFLGYIGVLVIKDTDVYKRVNAVVEWYEKKSMSHAVGLRVNTIINKKTKQIKHKVVYKATDGETYKAVYSKEFGYWFYMNEDGVKKECH